MSLLQVLRQLSAGQFLTVSFYGYIDHHIAEVLFSTIFCLAYGYALFSEKDRKIDFSDSGSYRQTLILSLLCGIAYLLGLFVMPTMILFAMIVAVFTVVQFIIDFSRNRSSDYLLVINGITFLVAIIGLLIFGFKSTLVDLSTYSVGHVYAYIGLIGGTLMLWYLARHLRGKKWYYYPGVLAGTGILLTLLLFAHQPVVVHPVCLRPVRILRAAGHHQHGAGSHGVVGRPCMVLLQLRAPAAGRRDPGCPVQ